MEKLSVDFKNCYGIEELKYDFDFSKNRIIGLYSPNGTMKTSFAKSFLRISEGKLPVEELFGHNTFFSVKIDETPIEKEDIFVIKSYIPNYDNIDKASTLLVDEKNKAEYDEAFAKILTTKNSLIAKLNRLSGVKKEDVEKQLLLDTKQDDFFLAIQKIQENDYDYDFSKIKYSIIFNEDVVKLLKNDDVAKYIDDYIKKYNELIANYSYLKKGVFNPNKAENVLKSLKKERFFKADHTVNLSGIENPVDEKEFEGKIQHIKDEIAKNEKLKEIQTLITKKVSVINFQELLEQNSEIIPEITLSKLNGFKEKLWVSYLKDIGETINDLTNLYNENKTILTKIEQEANSQKTIWDEVIEQFTQRFKVPYILEIVNKKSAVLGLQTPNIAFKFLNKQTGKYEFIQRKILDNKDILSQGERRALYLLNIIYEVKIREENSKQTIFIIDDIADSFDYQNKYAILEYLKDISNNDFFYQIILTHNFDFFRTIQERLLINGSKWHNSLITIRDNGKLTIIDDAGGKYITSPFSKWKNALNSDEKYLIASIPFVRNLIQYKEGESSDFFKALTSVLHYKNYSDERKATELMEIQDLKPIFLDTIKNANLNGHILSNKIYDLIFKQAELIINETAILGINLENKIILSIAIRLNAEKYMFSILTDKTIPDKFQTSRLFERCKSELIGGNTGIKNIDILEQVNIMTPENIHLNSFMYEPLIDLSENHLIELYKKTKLL